MPHLTRAVDDHEVLEAVSSSGRASIRVDAADGGRLTSIRVDDFELLSGSVPAVGLPVEIFTGSFIMAPFVGRLRHGRFDFDGNAYSVPTNAGAHAIHGLAFDRPWTWDGEGLTYRFDSRWPFGGGVRQTFDLTDDGLTMTATVFNEECRMPAVVGFHPWFARSAGGHELTYDVEPGPRFRTDSDGIPSGHLDDSGEGPWDDSFLGMRRAPVLTWGDLEVTLALGSSHWIVCDTMPGAVCVEPLSGPVAGIAEHDLPGGSAAVVGPGQPLSLDLTLNWRRIQAAAWVEAEQ